MSEPAGPLAGIKVLEIATVIMGPYATQQLGDLGAEVIKIETDKGDGSRVIGDGPHPELSGIALNLHRNKRSIGIDLKHEAGREVVMALLAECDVLVTNLRPGPLRRLGLDHDQLAERFPRLVHCVAHGFRSDSPEAERPAYDDIIQALAGFPQLSDLAFGDARFVPSVIADKVAGMFIAQGVLAALVARGSTGRGQSVEVPMFDAALAFNLVEHLSRAATPGEPPGYSRSLTSHRGPHRTKDGVVAMMPYTDEHWEAILAAADRTDLLERPAFANQRTRLNNADEVYGLLAGIVGERTTDEWLALCYEQGIPASPVPPLDDIVSEPEHHRGVLTEHEHPVVGTYRQIEQPVRFSESGRSTNRPAPLRSQDTEELLAASGYSDEEIARLAAAGVVELRSEPEHPQ